MSTPVAGTATLPPPHAARRSALGLQLGAAPVTPSDFFFSSRRRHTRFDCDWSSDVCSSDLRYLSRARSVYRLPLLPVRRPGENKQSTRSEERRVGKECRSGWWPYH